MDIKHCRTCKYAQTYIQDEPCASCDKNEHSNWADNDTTIEKNLEQIANQLAVANALTAYRIGLLSHNDAEAILDMIVLK